MRFTNCLKIVCVSALMVCATFVLTDQAQAISGPAFPAPGGTTATPDAGQTGLTGGKTFTYTGFNTSSFSDLWWAPTQILGPLSSPSGGPGTSQNIGANSPVISGNTATWTASTNWTIATTFGNTTPQVRFTLSTFDLNSAPVNLISAASVPGLLGSAGAVLDVTGLGLTGGYKANYRFEASTDSGTTWVATDTYFNSLGNTLCTNCVIKSVNAGFWDNAPTSVPEPGSILLLGAGLVGLGLGRYLVNRAA